LAPLYTVRTRELGGNIAAKASMVYKVDGETCFDLNAALLMNKPFINKLRIKIDSLLVKTIKFESMLFHSASHAV